MKYTKIFFLIFYGFFGYLSLMGMQKNQPIVVEIENVFFQSEIENEKDNYIRSPLVYGSENSISFLPRVENPCLLLLEGKDNFTKLLNKINTNEDQKIIFLQLKEYQQKTENQQPIFLSINISFNKGLLKSFLEANINPSNSHFNMTQSSWTMPQMAKILIGGSFFVVISAIVIYMYKYKSF